MTNESSGLSIVPRGSNKFLYISLGTIVVVFAIILIIIWQLGFFNFTGTDPSSTVVAAAVALIGTILTAVVSVVGILIKHSFDQQALIRQGIEARRNEALKREAEQRLNLEAATSALKLFSTSDGKPTPDIQHDGALFTLSNLGLYQLTIELVNSLLDKEELSAGTAASLLSNVLLQGNESEKEQAIMVLYHHPKHMLIPEGVAIPGCLNNWSTGLPGHVREWGILAIAEILLARPLAEWWEKHTYRTCAILATVCLAWDEEKEPRLKNDTGAILNVLLKAFPEPAMIMHPRKAVNLVRIRDEVEDPTALGAAYIEIVQRLQEWARPVEPDKKRKKASTKANSRTA